VTDPLGAALGLIRDVPDFPRPGVLFRDLTPLLAEAAAFRVVVDAMAVGLPAETEVLLAVESRGFLLAAAIGRAVGLGVVPVRKPGKLPLVKHRVSYALEYGTATLELPADVLRPGVAVTVVDDVLATGGTAAAACALAELDGAVVAGITVLLELGALDGRSRLAGRNVTALATV
jgi:adenine phosphoribosyltransferase